MPLNQISRSSTYDTATKDEKIPSAYFADQLGIRSAPANSSLRTDTHTHKTPIYMREIWCENVGFLKKNSPRQSARFNACRIDTSETKHAHKFTCFRHARTHAHTHPHTAISCRRRHPAPIPSPFQRQPKTDRCVARLNAPATPRHGRSSRERCCH